MSQIKVIQTELAAQNLQDIISQYEETNPELANFLRQQDFTELSKYCLTQAVELTIKNNPELFMAKTIKDYYNKEQDSWGGLLILAVLKSPSFDRGLGICVKDGGALVLAVDDYNHQSEVQEIKQKFIAAFQSVYINNILQIIGYEPQITKYQDGKYYLLAEEA